MKILVAIYPFLTDIATYPQLDLTVNPWGGEPSEEKIAKEFARCSYDGIIVGTKKIRNEIAQICPNLRVISRVGAGYENVDVDYFKCKGIATTITPDAPTHATAEQTVAMLLTSMRKIVQYNQMIKEGHWTRSMIKGLEGCAVAIVGTGRIGKRVATILKVFGVNLLLYDTVPDIDFAHNVDGQYVSKEQILMKADIITLHLPHNEKTKFWLQKEDFQALGNREVVIVNAARGALVNEEALIHYLKENPQSSYCADVFNNEPYTGDLCRLPNTILTPHVSTMTVSSRLMAEKQAIDNMLLVLEGKLCKDVL